jgi:hypothetical protein
MREPMTLDRYDRTMRRIAYRYITMQYRKSRSDWPVFAALGIMRVWRELQDAGISPMCWYVLAAAKAVADGWRLDDWRDNAVYPDTMRAMHKQRPQRRVGVR